MNLGALMEIFDLLVENSTDFEMADHWGETPL